MTKKRETSKKRKYNRVAEILNEMERNISWLAKHSNVSRNSVSKICKNDSQPGLPVLFELAKALGKHPCDLLDDGREIKD